MTDTIFARASGAGKAGVAVFRISGPKAVEIAESLAREKLVDRGFRRVNLRAPQSETQSETGIDDGLALLFKGPGSFTGEDVVELQLHGSAAVEAGLYEALSGLGARPAEAGEFTRRALENGKLDLAQVEALADLIDAETSQQRLQALGQLGGGLSARAERWRKRILAILAPLEADIDFPDEESVPAAVAARAGPEIEALISELEAHRASAETGRAIRHGVNIVILGAPNAGKSSLLNRLAGSDHAIVSETPGTTRDVIEVRLDLGGVPVTLADTAGLRNQSTDNIELEGMRRTRQRAEAADIRVLVIDPLTDQLKFDAVTDEMPENLHAGDFLIRNKLDLARSGENAENTSNFNGLSEHNLSAKTGDGVENFIFALTKAVEARCHIVIDAPLTRARHLKSVETAIKALNSAQSSIKTAPELAAEDARLAARALGGITGAVGVEDVLGEIFSSFCIGK